jgi:hypothetical protein
MEGVGVDGRGGDCFRAMSRETRGMEGVRIASRLRVATVQKGLQANGFKRGKQPTLIPG